jgi:hypothetical protein
MQPNYWAREKLDQFDRPAYNLFYVQLGEMDSSGWCWDGLDGYDYRQYDLHIASILDKRPDAKLNVFLGGKVPYQWQLKHPEEMILREDGVRTNLASPSSERWIEDSCEAVRRLVEHYENGPFADSIAGYNPIYVSNEWLLGTLYTDHNETNRRRFAAWLREAYDGDVERLRDRWKQPDLDFDTVTLPTDADYDGHGLKGMFDRHEVYGSQAADYLRFFNRSVADLLLAHAATIKQASDRRKFVSAMFGYSYCYPNVRRSPPHSSHWDLMRVLASDDIDLLHSPYDYFNRCLGGPHYSQLPPDSVLAHGKVFATQIDTKTHIHTMAPGNAATPWESEQVLKRDVAYAFTRNAYHYYYEMNEPAWRGRTGTIEYRELGYIDPRVQDTIVKLRDVADANHAELPRKNAEVAWFNSRESAYYRAFDKRYNGLFVQATRNYFLPYTATPFDDYLLEDFERIDRDYKVYIFPDASHVSPRLRDAIRSRLSRIGATAVWFYAPGYFDGRDTRGSLDSMHELTGMRFEKRGDLRDTLRVEFDRFDHPITQGLEAIGGFGSDYSFDYFQSRQEWLPWMLKDPDDYKFNPFFVVDDPDAEALGTLRGARQPGLATKTTDGMKSVYMAAPCPPPELLMNVFRDAGVHLYSDRGDLVYANERYVCLNAIGAGPRTLRLPRRAALYDAMEGTLLEANTDRYTHEAQDKQVDIFRLDPPVES